MKKHMLVLLIFLLILITFYSGFIYAVSGKDEKNKDENVLATGTVKVYVHVINKKGSILAEEEENVNIEFEWKEKTTKEETVLEGEAGITIDTDTEATITSIQSQGFDNKELNNWFSYQFMVQDQVKGHFGPGSHNALTEAFYTVKPGSNSFIVKAIYNRDSSEKKQLPDIEDSYSDVITITYGATQTK